MNCSIETFITNDWNINVKTVLKAGCGWNKLHENKLHEIAHRYFCRKNKTEKKWRSKIQKEKVKAKILKNGRQKQLPTESKG